VNATSPLELATVMAGESADRPVMPVARRVTRRNSPVASEVR
jgi:hypothetical protein